MVQKTDTKGTNSQYILVKTASKRGTNSQHRQYNQPAQAVQTASAGGADSQHR
jgi:hypothetical protein